MKKTAKVFLILAVVALLAVALVACIPSDYTKAAANLKDADYTVISGNTDNLAVKAIATALKIAGIEDVEAIVSGTKGTDTITIVYFKDASAAKNAMEKMEKYFDGEKKDDADLKVARSGKAIYGGTAQAVKDAK